MTRYIKTHKPLIIPNTKTVIPKGTVLQCIIGEFSAIVIPVGTKDADGKVIPERVIMEK